MAGNKMLRCAVRCSAAKKKQKERDKFRSTTRVILGEQKVRWDRLKADLNPKSDHKAGEVLLDTSTDMSRRVTAALVDLSGTIHIDDTAIKGAKEALHKLAKAGIKVKYVTNTTKEPLRLLHQRLTSLGFEIDRSEIFTSLSAARQLVETKQVRPFLLLEDSAKEDFKGISEDDPNAVVVGLAPSCFNYDCLNQAFRLLMDGAPLIAIHKARYYKTKDGLCLGPGPFVQGMEYAAGVTAEVVGKPEKTFFLEAIRNLGVSPHNTVMIGDDACDDVSGAIDAGMLGILVQTGKYREGDETKFSPSPTAVCPDIAAAVDYILERCV